MKRSIAVRGTASLRASAEELPCGSLVIWGVSRPIPRREYGAFFVYLEDIDENGVVSYVTEGELKASLRKLDSRPWKPELPWHRSYAQDAVELTPGQVEEVVLDLLPTSYVFLAGHRLRISVAGWDDMNFGGPKFDPPPTIRMYRDGVRASYVELPVIGEAAQIAPQPAAPSIVALPSTGSGPQNGALPWAPGVWVLLGSAGAAAAGGALCIRFARRRRGAELVRIHAVHHNG